MALAAGTKLGPYEVLARLGAGGMGEVYQARDTRLDRLVAIKVCNEQFSERFEREVRAIAALNHSHICTLYDVGHNYLVMELIQGDTLKAVLRKEPLPLAQVVTYGAQIADALAAAHECGITHRDLKPGNIMLTKIGIKILDFGLAKMTPSEETTLTASQAVMGTPAYMAPEQRAGRVCDGRTDIFALGLVLYEMAAGARTAGNHALPADRFPAQFSHVVERCLAEDPTDRWQAASDVKRELEWAGRTAATSQVTMPATDRRTGLPRWIWGVAVGVLGLGLALGWTVAHLRQPVAGTRTLEQPLVRFDVDLGAGVSLRPQAGVILSPDGNRLVYASQNRLFTRRLDQPKATEIAGTEGALAPFFSPDGQWVAFFAKGKLTKVSVEGGTPIVLCDAVQGRGGSWGEDGSIVAALNTGDVLSRIPSSGGTPTPVTELAPGEATHRWPQILPGGRAVLFTANTTLIGGSDGASVEVMSFKDRRRKTLQRGATFGRYLPTSNRTGHLVYINRGTLFARPLDPDTLEARGAPTPLLQEVAYNAATGFSQFDFSRTGTLVYRSGGAAGLFTVSWMDAEGRTQPLLTRTGFFGRPSLSPDGHRLALTITERSTDVWIYDWTRDTVTRVTFGGGSNDFPVWSPDGRSIAFQAQGGMSWTRADGAGKPQTLTQSKNPQFPSSFMPDGKRLAYVEVNPGTGNDLWTLPLESDGGGLRAGKPEVLLDTPFDERDPSFSPDGRWLAYSSNESGTLQVFVRAFPDTGGKWQISNSGGVYPMWSRNGRELFFETLDGSIMVSAYAVKGDSFVAEKPRVWSEKRLVGVAGAVRNFDLAQDGKRIATLMSADTPEEQTAQNQVIFLQNFFDEVRRRVPVGAK